MSKGPFIALTLRPCTASRLCPVQLAYWKANSSAFWLVSEPSTPTTTRRLLRGVRATHDDHGAGRVPGEVLAHRADHHAADDAVALGTEDDQRCTLGGLQQVGDDPAGAGDGRPVLDADLAQTGGGAVEPALDDLLALVHRPLGEVLEVAGRGVDLEREPTELGVLRRPVESSVGVRGGVVAHDDRLL